jgi:hypothetical protein
MNPFEMVVAIVAVVMIGRVLKARYAAPCDQGGVSPSRVDEELRSDNLRMLKEIDSLRERIQVLERVITDNHSASDLDREIERLRSK